MTMMLPSAERDPEPPSHSPNRLLLFSLLGLCEFAAAGLAIFPRNSPGDPDKLLLKLEPSELAALTEPALDGIDQAELEAFGNGLLVDTPPETPVYAREGEAGNLFVRCASTERGEIAVVMRSGDPAHFFKVGFLGECQSGHIKPGGLIGKTLGPLNWSQYSRESGKNLQPETSSPRFFAAGNTEEN